MADRFVVSMLRLHFGTPRDRQAREELAAALPADAEVTEPAELGVFDVHVEADDLEPPSTESRGRGHHGPPFAG